MRSLTVQFIPRDEFINERWSYKPGDHVTLITPTQNGKTTLACQLLEVTAHPGLQATMAVMKPRDPTPSEWTERLGFREVADWPPSRWPWQAKPPGYAHWPKHTFNVAADDEHLRDQFSRSLNDWYRKGDGIYFADEVQ
ncbi:MAG: hypothetical protein ACREKE_05975, partial [bacterium]